MSASPPAPTLAPTAAPSAVAGAPACEPSDLKASHGLVEGAAGSRLTTVAVTAANACSVDAFPAFGIRDANGAVLVSAPSGGPGRLDLVGGAVYESNLRLANWCASEPAFPLELVLLVAGAEVPVTGATTFPEQGDLPPCSGEGGAILEATAWVRAAT